MRDRFADGHREGLDACAWLIAQWAGEAGCAVDLVPSPVGLHVVARTHGAGPARALLGHHDTVFPPGTAARGPCASRATGCSAPAWPNEGRRAGRAGGARAARARGRAAGVDLHCVPDEEGRTVAPPTLELMRGADAALCFECGRESARS